MKAMSAPGEKMLGLAMSESAVNQLFRIYDWNKDKHTHLLRTWEVSKLFYMNTFM